MAEQCEGGQRDSSALGVLLDKAMLVVRPLLGVLCLAVIILSVAGAATSSQPNTAQGLFIAILFFSCLSAFVVVMCKVLKSGGRSKYQINEKPAKKAGQVNGAYDDDVEAAKKEAEKKEGGGQEAWMNNYVPYGKVPEQGPMEQVTFTKEGGKETSEKEVMVEEVESGAENAKDNDNEKDNYISSEDEEENHIVNDDIKESDETKEKKNTNEDNGKQ